MGFYGSNHQPREPKACKEGLGFNPIRSTSLCCNNTTKNKAHTHINTNKSMHSEMGTV